MTTPRSATDHLAAARACLARALEQISRDPHAASELASARDLADDVATYVDAIAVTAATHAKAHGPSPWSGSLLTLISSIRTVLNGLRAVLTTKTASLRRGRPQTIRLLGNQPSVTTKEATHMTIDPDYIEPDAFWFSDEWCQRHPDAPLAVKATESTSPTNPTNPKGAAA